MSTREMPGIIDFTGTTVNSLRVGRAIRIRPAPVHETECSICGSRSTAAYAAIRDKNASCRASGCGKTAKLSGRELLIEQRRIAAQREAEAEQAAVDASAARMEAECAADRWERPTKYAPSPSKHVVMSERDRLELKAHKEAEEAAQRAADAPRLEAERKAAIEQAQREHAKAERREKQTAYMREWVLTDRDRQLFVSPELANVSMPQSKAEAHNLDAVQQFVATTQEYGEYRTPENAGKITDYLSRNGVNIFDVATLRAAFVRLRELGILTKRETPKAEPTPAPQRVNLGISEPPKSADDANAEHGWDYNGQPLTLTSRQVARLSADEYRRFKKLDRASLELPNTGPSTTRRYAETEA